MSITAVVVDIFSKSFSLKDEIKHSRQTKV
jgi:hypothetical protein